MKKFIKRAVHIPRRMYAGIIRQILRLRGANYRSRLDGELASFSQCEEVHGLPEIFHYWSNKYLLPMQLELGIRGPEHFFQTYSITKYEEIAGDGRKTLRIASLGTGNCDVEIGIASELAGSGREAFTIDCVEINSDMLQRGRQLAIQTGVEKHVRAQRGDFNRWRPRRDYDVIIANQALHHVVKLERLFATIKKHLRPAGVLLTSDTIGRNGHRKWPEAMRAIQPFWEELPSRYRFNRQLHRQEDQLVDHDCSADCFEGIRAQDILPLLVQYFHFELFIPFAGIILTFIDRAFGPNFDPENAWDREFIDRVHARDEEGLLSGELKPTQMLAVLRNEPVEPRLVHPKLTPQFCIREAGGEEI